MGQVRRSACQDRHLCGLNHLHYITTSTYRRARVFDSERFKRRFVSTWAELRDELGFRIRGYVLMPEHFYVLLWPCELSNPSQIMQKLEERTAKFILKSLREKAESAWCEGMLRAFTLPPTVHHHAHHRVWQRRFYDMNIWSDKKMSEKLDTMHNNPVKRGLVEKPGDWSRPAVRPAGSSWRFYYLEDSSVLAMDRMP
jgi:putative transposase